MAKKLREEDLVLNIIVNGNKGQKEAAELGREMRDAKIEVDLLIAEQKKLEKQGRQNTTRYKEVTAEIAKNNTVIETNRKRLTELGQSMKLTDQSISQLRRTLSQLNKLKNQAIPGSEEYKRYEMQIQAINNRLSELGVRARGTGTALNRMGSGISRYFGGITAGIASITSIVFGFRKAIDEFSRFDDQLADVQKTTNLAKEEVKELSDELENIRTRTSQEDLLGLARIGGKLGISDQNDLVGFVDSMNKIVVALNEDLGGNVEETVNQMGKLVDIFGVKEMYGIEQSILKVGSAINELGMASTANEGYLVDFSQRMAGVAPLADISIQEILGLGATLDQFGQTAEVSGTALSKLFLELSKDAASFAKYAGMEVNSFKDLLEKDFMAAFTRVLAGIKGNSEGINQLAATLGDLGIDGQRVIGVIGTLANNHEVLTEQINLSNAAFEEGASIIDEYDVKNETAAARLEMSRKEVTKFWRELGEKLYPVMTSINNSFVTILQLITKFIEFIGENYRWIVTLTVGITSLTIATNAQTIATKTGTIATQAATVATRVFNAVLRANPIGLVITLLATLGTAMAMYSKQTSETNKIQLRFKRINEDVEKSLNKERSAIDNNIAAIRDENKSKEEKLVAVKNLRDIMPRYLKDYTDEEILAGKATKAIENYIEAIKLEMQIKRQKQELEEILAERANDELNFYEKARFEIEKQILGVEVASRNLAASRLKYNEGLKASEEAVFDALLKTQQQYNENVKLREEATDAKDDDTDSGTASSSGDQKSKSAQKAEDRLNQQINEWRLQLEKEDGFADKQLEQLAKKYRQLMNLAGKDGKKQAEITAIYEKLAWERKLEILQEGAQKYRQRQLSELDDLNAETLQKDNEAYLARLQAIDQMDISEQEKANERARLQEEQQQVEFTREQEKLNQRWLLLQQFETLGELELDEAKRIADEKLQIEKQLTDNQIAESLRLSKQREDSAKSMAEAETALADATTSAMVDSLGAMKDLFKGNEALAKSFLVLEKLAAAAHVITSLQREVAGYYAAYALIPGGVAIATKLAAAAKIRAGASLVTIAAQTIGGLASSGNSADGTSSGSTPQRMTPRFTGRERGGFLVQRDQDGKTFNARFNPFKRGYVGGPTVIVGENGSEFVANAQAVANPSIKPLLDVIDIAQRNGSISTLNLENVLLQDRKIRMRGYESGGSISDTSRNPSSVNTINLDELNRNQKELAKVVKDLRGEIQKGITAEVSLLGKNGFIEKQKELNEIQNRASL